MKALFVHSHIFSLSTDGTVYSDGKLPYAAWVRYLKHFGGLHVIARCKPASPQGLHTLCISSGSRVQFSWAPELNRISTLLSERRKAKKLIHEAILGVDAVVVRLSTIGWMAAAEARRQGKPWAVEVVGDVWDAYWNYGTTMGKLCAPIAYWQAKQYIARAPFAIYVTNEHLQKRYPCGGFTSHASNVEIVDGDESVLSFRQSRLKVIYSDTNTRVKCGLIGNLSARYKGLHVALQAIKRLRELGITVHLHNLGEGNLAAYRNEAERIGVSDLLHLDGTRPSGYPVIEWLDSMDLYIQPSLTEGLPRALVEAISRGLPCLASNVGGIPELLPAECLHRPGDHKKLASDMERLIKDPEWRTRLCLQNFETAKQYYAEHINRRRDAFWTKFADYARDKITG